VSRGITLVSALSAVLIAGGGVELGAVETPWTIDTVLGTGRPGPAGAPAPAAAFPIGQPFGVEVGPDGALYVCEVESHRLVRLDLTAGTAAAVAGSGKKGHSGDGGPALAASLDEPYEVRFDGAGHMYFVEMVGAVVRRVDGKSGIIGTVAGTGAPGFGGDGGPAVKAQLRQPHSIALDQKGGLYIADIGNGRIRRVDLASGRIETPPGCDFSGKDVPAARRGPRALAIDGTSLWIAFREGNSVARMDLRTGQVTPVAGTGEKGARDGPGSEAQFNGPKGIAAARSGIYVVDTENQTIRRIDPATGAVSTIAGGRPASRGFGGDAGPAPEARMDRPHGICAGPPGPAGETLFIGDTNNHRVRRLTRAK
jgi:sugar lactone lactonase YvrE